MRVNTRFRCLAIVAFASITLYAGPTSDAATWFEVKFTNWPLMIDRPAIAIVTSVNAPCITVPQVQAVDATETVKFLVQCEANGPPNCKSDLFVKVYTNTNQLVSVREERFRCEAVCGGQVAGGGAVPEIDDTTCLYPGCMCTDICAEPGGGSATTAIDVSECFGAESSHNGVPALSDWGMVILVMLVLAVGTYRLRIRSTGLGTWLNR